MTNRIKALYRERLRENPVAAFFLRRQLIKMPAFGAGVTDDEVRQIGAYIRWLRLRSTKIDTEG